MRYYVKPQVTQIYFDLRQGKQGFKACANNKYSVQPAHPRSLTRVFVLAGTIFEKKKKDK